MPSVNSKQRRFMGMQLAKQRKTGSNNTGMSEQQLSDFAGSVKKTQKEKPGRSLVDIEYHEGADQMEKIDGGIVHPIHKLKGPIVWGSDEFQMDGKASIPGNSSALRDIGNGIHYGAKVIDRGPETEFRVEEINPQHYGRDWEPAPWKDYFKTEDKAEELGIRREEDLEYQECEKPGAVTGAYASSLAYGTISFERIPTENTDHRTFESQQKFRRAQNEYDESVIGDDD